MGSREDGACLPQLGPQAGTRPEALGRGQGSRGRSAVTWEVAHVAPSTRPEPPSAEQEGAWGPDADSAAATRLGQSGSRAPRQDPDLWQILPRTPLHAPSLPWEGSTHGGCFHAHQPGHPLLSQTRETFVSLSVCQWKGRGHREPCHPPPGRRRTGLTRADLTGSRGPQPSEASTLPASDGQPHPSSLGTLMSRAQSCGEANATVLTSPQAPCEAWPREWVILVALALPSARTALPPPLCPLLHPWSLQSPHLEELTCHAPSTS